MVAAACSKDSYDPKVTPSPTPSGGGEDTPTQPTTSTEIQYATMFARDVLSTYYLWEGEIAGAIENELNPSTCTDPVSTVEKIRYKEGGGYDAGKDEDRWTRLFPDASEFIDGLAGVENTHGMSVTVGEFTGTNPVEYFLIVNFLYEGSPAAKTGIKRGDVIISFNGKSITDANVRNAYYGWDTATYGLGEFTKDGIRDTGEEVTITPSKMYLNPIICHKTFDVNGKKVGYLMYDGFDLDGCEQLVQISKQFKSEGVKELILDMRYNGGGYVFTENFLASLLAPKANVDAGDLYMTEVYNKDLDEYWSKSNKDYNKTFFTWKHEVSIEDSDGNAHDYKFNTANANIGLEKIYGIVSSGTASAAESILVGLNPYLDITTIGKQSHGKYCTGTIFVPYTENEISAVGFYTERIPEIEKWGMYCMIATYADRDGKNMARPVGIVPDIEASDYFNDAGEYVVFDIGDENEPMLQKALMAAGKKFTTVATTRSLNAMPQFNTKQLEDGHRFGMRVMLPPMKPGKAIE